MVSSRRDHLVDTALALFMRDGFHATGIDRILSHAGVAKMTLYNHFKSKDELILAALRLRDERFLVWFTAAVERRAENPRGRLLALFGALDEWINEPDFAGCAFINAAAEYGRPDDPIHLAAAEHKRLVRDYVRGIAAAAGARDAEVLADALNLLMEGAIVTAHVGGRKDAAKLARRVATVLIERALGGSA
ncbi:MAG: TetR/AcrR family transcriptional regulator [Proteobacteria bacterium]|nr:TetR/AcrR family transcriptional regulator [Pseudomonadota bacterium]